MVLSHSWFLWVLVRRTILWICVAMTGKLVLRFGGVAAEIIQVRSIGSQGIF